ncbi:MAG: hypothetical protein AAFR65_04615 [Pseudomonadota bacterium]
MDAFIYTVDDSVATVQYEERADSFAEQFAAILEEVAAAGVREVLLDNGDMPPTRYKDALADGKLIARRLVSRGVRLAVLMRDDDHSTKIIMAAAALEGATIMIGRDRQEAYDWLRGHIK